MWEDTQKREDSMDKGKRRVPWDNKEHRKLCHYDNASCVLLYPLGMSVNVNKDVNCVW
jgi:hypothetical protein